MRRNNAEMQILAAWQFATSTYHVIEQLLGLKTWFYLFIRGSNVAFAKQHSILFCKILIFPSILKPLQRKRRLYGEDLEISSTFVVVLKEKICRAVLEVSSGTGYTQK